MLVSNYLNKEKSSNANISLCISLFLDTVPLLVSPTSDPEGELEQGELRMELPRMKGE